MGTTDQAGAATSLLDMPWDQLQQSIMQQMVDTALAPLTLPIVPKVTIRLHPVGAETDWDITIEKAPAHGEDGAEIVAFCWEAENLGGWLDGAGSRFLTPQEALNAAGEQITKAAGARGDA